jgi:putative CocE/NonD family hydrolase
MTVGGWFDAENLFGALETFRNVEASARPESVNILVMGPWSHGGWSGGDGSSLGAVPFKVRTGEYFREQIEFPFFERFLKGDSEVEFPKAIVFETGTNRFRDFDRWPPAEARPTSLYLRSGGKLALEPPAEDRRAFDEYVSDPAKPVPYLETTTFRMAGDYMIADQRFAGRRPDVLVYESEILDEDFTIVGPIKVDLHVQTSGTDSDWIVKLIDVYPDDFPDPDPNPAGIHLAGYQQMVRGDVMRGKFYKGLDKPEALPSNSPVRMRFTMQDVDHSFRRGHRMMIQVQSSWFPLVDRNPQKFVDIYAAKVADFEKATQRVYRDADRASRIEVLKLDAR